MPKAVQFDRHGGIEVLHIAEVPMPTAEADRVVVQMKAAGINPGEAAIRQGYMPNADEDTFPSGEGSDLAGVITEVGSEVTSFSVGDEVLGWSWERSSHAEYVSVPANQLIPKPANLSWEQAGAMYVVACTAYAAVNAVDPKPGDTIAVSGAAGGVGTIAVQYLATKGVTNILGIASEKNGEWLSSKGVTAIAYGDGLESRLEQAAPNGVDAFIDLFGPEYLQLASDIGVKPERINTIISFQKAQELGAKAEGSSEATNTKVLTEMSNLVANGQIEMIIAGKYKLDAVQDAYTELEKHHTRGKIVLVP